mmetsp:Transcript_42283/g.72825  ORF Transcript_42283/g.72825 Transcript_42283/m.72825 type:complete len:325 (+) Transcript_42283:209-1183(+)
MDLSNASLARLETPGERLQRMQRSYKKQLQQAHKAGLVDVASGFGIDDPIDATPRTNTPPKPTRLVPPVPPPPSAGGPAVRSALRPFGMAPTAPGSSRDGGSGAGGSIVFGKETKTLAKFSTSSLATMTHDDKDRTILTLQREVEALKSQLAQVLDTSEATMADIAKAQEQAYEEQMLREEELHAAVEKWKSAHPEVNLLEQENNQLREELAKEQKKTQFMIKKLSRVHDREAKLKASRRQPLSLGDGGIGKNTFTKIKPSIASIAQKLSSSNSFSKRNGNTSIHDSNKSTSLTSNVLITSTNAGLSSSGAGISNRVDSSLAIT